MKALIDGDLLVYRVGFTTMDTDEGIAQWRMNTSIEKILQELNTEDYTCYLTGQGRSNYRYDIYPEYKANRKAPKPTHYYFLREFLVEHHGAVVIEGQEADDQMGIDQTNSPTETIIVSIDKDLDQIPGWHYNFVKTLKYEISSFEGMKFFYTQLLTGDRTDNIMGISGIGPVKAGKLLKDCTTEQEMYDIVNEQYQIRYADNWFGKITCNGQLLKIRTREGELWEPPS